MIKSMTGYGKSSVEDESKKISIEIKSLNSKQFDLNVKVPAAFREKEMELRNMVLEKLIRGKIDLLFYIETKNAENIPVINEKIVEGYYKQLNNLRQKLGIEKTDDLLGTILRLPDTLKNEKEELAEEEWNNIKNLMNNALVEVDEFRKQEGEAMKVDIVKRINNILALNNKIEKFEKARINNIKNRIENNLNGFFDEDKIDKNRFEQELIYYLEKIDITEEKVRLKNHCSFFLKTIDETNEGGKKLSFISQEMGREINTIGSKANDSEIQRIVVEMKDELEKIKEQTLNIL